MRPAILCAAIFCVGTIGAQGTACGAPAAPASQPAVSLVIPIQEWRQRCRYLRHRLRELEERRVFAPPWQQRRVEHRIWETREQLRYWRCW